MAQGLLDCPVKPGNDIKVGKTQPMSEPLPAVSVAEKLAERIAAVDPARLPQATRTKCEDLAVDVIGLCLTVRNADYVKATLAACDDDGALLEQSYLCAFITCPAVNAKVVLERDRSRRPHIQEAMRARILKVLAIAAARTGATPSSATVMPTSQQVPSPTPPVAIPRPPFSIVYAGTDGAVYALRSTDLAMRWRSR